MIFLSVNMAINDILVSLAINNILVSLAINDIPSKYGYK
jgi:hypothetical protein